jgi:2-polyprenyl-6-methoxyphenol hydroxylase-like FAD-dependent oxidoreductase
MMGQGRCIAMEDACVLAEELRAAATMQAALESYVRRGKPRTEWVQRQSMGLANLSPLLRQPATIRFASGELNRRQTDSVLALSP